MSAVQRQKSPSTFQITNQRTSQPIWKKVNDRARDTTSLQKTSNNTKYPNTNYDNNFNQFLLKIQKKISQSRLSSQSEVMQKISIDWEEQIQPGCKLSRYVSFDSPSRLQKGSCQRCQEIVNLKEIREIQKLIQITKEINPSLHQQLTSIISTNETLQNQNKMLKQNEVKAKQKISYLCKNVLGLQKRNADLVNDFNQLSKEVSTQIKLQQERIKYQYEQKLWEMRLEMTKKNNKEQSAKTYSTRHSASVNQFNKSQDNAQQMHKLTVTNINEKNDRSQKNQKNLASLGNDKQENFERVLFDILKPHKRQDRSLKLPQNPMHD